MSKQDFEYQNSIFFTQCECQIRLSVNVKIGFQMSFSTQYECQNRILNIKMSFSTRENENKI